MLTATTQLGGFQEDLVNILGPILGRDKVLSIVTGLRTEVRTEAEAGAKRAIPEIRAEVRKEATATMRPWIIGSLAVGGLGLILGIWAMRRTKKR